MGKAIFLSLIFILSGALGYFLFSGTIPVSEVVAGASDNVSGWAWSENTGWISFNCSNCENNPQCDKRATCNGTHKDYGVDIDDSGVLSGYALSQKGEYAYYCDVPGHEARGEKGVMVVK